MLGEERHPQLWLYIGDGQAKITRLDMSLPEAIEHLAGIVTELSREHWASVSEGGDGVEDGPGDL